MKRIFLALASLGITSGALAAYPAAINPTEVSVPQLPGGLLIGLTGYYLQPSDTSGDFDYASVISGTPPPPPNFFTQTVTLQPNFDAGWGFNLGYIFPGTGNDINANYFHFDTDDTDSVSGVPGLEVILPVSFSGGGIVVPFSLSSSKIDIDTNQIDVTAGQYINVGCRLTLHPNVGIRWTDIERKMNENFLSPLVTPSATEVVNEKSDFSGVGPLAGIDASFYIAYGVGAVAHFNSALLVGNVDSTLNATTNPVFPVPIISNYSLKSDSTRRVVPAADAKVGLDYTYVFNNAMNSDLTLEGGYQWSHYYNSIDRIIGSGTLTSSTILAHRTTDFGLNGLYINLTLHL